jgi:hypothetical protein
MRGRSVALSFLPFLVVLAGCELEGIVDSSRFQEEFQQSHPMKAGGRLYMENFNGAVEISGWDKDSIDISGTKHAGTQSALDAMKVDVVVSGDSVRIRTIRPSERWGNMGVRYTIRVPRRTTLEKISTSNGAINVSGIQGPVRIITSNGAVRADNLEGGLEASTSNGAVHADNIRGGLEATTSNGAIEASLMGASDGRPIRLRTSNGSVDLTLDEVGVGGATVSTSNSTITMHLPPGIAANVDASTSNGSINNDFEAAFRGRSDKRHLEGEIGSGGPKLSLSTSNGRINLRRR